MIKELRILIVDDSEHWLLALVDILPTLFEKMNSSVNIHIDTTDSAKKAGELIENENQYDVWIMDIRLANAHDEDDQSGLAFIKKYLGTSYLANVKIIIATGYPTHEYARTALRDLHVSDFIAKNDGIRNLHRAICEAVGMPPP